MEEPQSCILGWGELDVGGALGSTLPNSHLGPPSGAFRALDKEEEFSAGLMEQERKGSRCVLNTNTVRQNQHLPRESALGQAD